MKIEFDPDAHLYVVDGEPFPSVTTIIKAVVPVPFDRAAWWGYKMARQGLRMDEKRNSAAIMGTRVHKLFEERANGFEVDPFDFPDCAGFIEAIDRFFDKNDPEFFSTEKKVASMMYEYAGTMDAFCEFRKGPHKGATARIDVKTGKVYPESHFPQLEAYEHADVELRGGGAEPSDFRAVLDLKPTGKYRLVKSTDTFHDFKVLLDHFRSVEARKARKKR